MLLDRNGLFHPDANRMRTEATMHAEMKRLINMDRIEEKILQEMFAESKGKNCCWILCPQGCSCVIFFHLWFLPQH